MANENRPEIVLDGDVTPFRQKLREAAADLRRFGDDGVNALQRMSSPLASLQSQFVAISGVLSGLVLGSSIKSVVDQADAIDEMSDRTGIAVESLARLKFAGEQTGIAIGSVGDVVKKLAKIMVEAGSGNEEAGRKLKAFGVSAEEIKRMDIPAALQAIADRVRDLPEAARQGALESLAKGFGDLAPLLKNGADGLRDLFEQADRLGVTSGYVAAAAGAASLNDAIDRLSGTATGVSQRVIADFLPSLTSAADGMGEMLLSAERNKESLLELGTVAIGGVLTVALRDMTTQLYSSTAGWVSEVQATRQATAAKIAAAQSTANSAAALKTHAAMLLSDAEAAVANASGMARLSMVQSTLIPARRELAAATQIEAAAERALAVAKEEAAAKTSLAGMALNALGGPLGAIITLLGVGATAWAAFGRSGTAAVQSLTEEIERGREVLARYQREQKFGTGDEGQLRATLEAIEKRISILVQSSGASAGAAEELSKLRAEAEQLQDALDGIQSRNQPNKPKTGDFDKFLASFGAKKPDDGAMQRYEAALAQEKRLAAEKDALREYTKAEELAYWQTLLDHASLSAKDRLAIERKVADLTVAVRRQAAKEQQELDAEVLRHKESMSLGEVAAAEAAARTALDLGAITQQQMIEQEIIFEQRRQEVQRAALAERLRMAEEDPNISPAARQRLLNQIEEMDQQHRLRMGQLQGKFAKKQGALWEDLADRTSSLWDKGVAAMMNGTFTWRSAFKAVGAEMVSWFANSVVGNMVKKWIAGKTQELAVNLGFMKANEMAQQTSSQNVAGSKIQEATTVVAANAAGAGSGAANAMASIPWVGPVLALAAMASVFAAVSAMSGKIKSASRGYAIPKGVNPMMQLHEEEVVLPSNLSKGIQEIIDNGGAGAAVPAFSPQINITAMDSRDVVRALKDGRALQKALEDMERRFVRKKS